MQEIGAGRGRAVVLGAGDAIRIVNTHGTQVVDTWALRRGDSSEYLSVEHTRRMLLRLSPRRGDRLFSNRRTPLLLIEEDTAPGRHDMLLACCDPWLYKYYGCAPGHRNCRDNFREALFEAGFDSAIVPNPINLWMSIPVTGDDMIALAAPVSRPGDHVLLRALVEVVVVMSACPMDVTIINGADRIVRPVHFEILPAA